MRRAAVRCAARAAAAVVVAAGCTSHPAAGTYTRQVDPFIGTGGHGHTHPAATLPFGMVQVGPDTRLEGWDGSSGYHWTDSHIYGFSHTHLSGTGIGDYCDILLMPGTGTPRLENGAGGGPGYRSAFRKQTERASPGYYAVRLDDPGVDVELTASARAGFHRYRFPAADTSWVVLDLAHRDRVRASALEVVSDTEVRGMRRSTSWARDQRVWFHLRFSRPFTDSFIAGEDSLKAWFRFDTRRDREVMVQVGISAVDAEGARRNLDTEMTDWDFERVRAQADSLWDAELGRIRVRGGSKAERTTFYTALYHTLLAPNLFSDSDGRYRGIDGGVHQAAGREHYTVFSLWDTFRAAHPLYALLQRQRTRDFIRTFLAMYRQGGRLPVWELAGNETDTMIGYHAVPVILDAVVKGIGGFDTALALEAMVASADRSDPGLDAYRRQGFVPAGADGESVSKTLEYAYDDWCIAEMARLEGRTDLQERFTARAQSYINLFDPESRFMRPRVNGGWADPFDPREVTFHFTEANSWQYSFFVPQDVRGLAALLGGPEALAAKLDSLFEADPETTGRRQADITGLVGQYAHGNEPSHHMAYLYAWTPEPWKGQGRVRQIMDELYGPAPDGLAGNEDCGQMSAWFVFSALGLYPVTPGSPVYVLGSPLFPGAEIILEDGSRIGISAPGTDRGRPYLGGVRLDGETLDRLWVTHDELTGGAPLRLDMTGDPAQAMVPGPARYPPPDRIRPPIQPSPFVAAGERAFAGSTRVALGALDEGSLIRYTVDGSDPGPDSAVYTAPIVVDRRTDFVMRAQGVDGTVSPPVEAHFRPMPEGRDIELGTRYARQYAAGGQRALIDGIRGGSDFRTGDWQGYQGEDLTATVDLGEVQPLEAVTVGFLQDVGSWIWLPARVEVMLSSDGERFRRVGTLTHPVPEDRYGGITRDFSIELRGRRARYVRIVASNRGTCPPWHPGAGGRAWLFADEIVVVPR